MDGTIALVQAFEEFDEDEWTMFELVHDLPSFISLYLSVMHENKDLVVDLETGADENGCIGSGKLENTSGNGSAECKNSFAIGGNFFIQVVTNALKTKTLQCWSPYGVGRARHICAESGDIFSQLIFYSHGGGGGRVQSLLWGRVWQTSILFLNSHSWYKRNTSVQPQFTAHKIRTLAALIS